MADATQPLSNIVSYDEKSVWSIPVADGVTIYRGTLVEHEAVTGDAVAASDQGPVAGVAIETVIGHASTTGAVYVRVARRARVILNGTATLAAAAGTGVNLVAYPSDNQTVTNVAGTNVAGRVFSAEGFTARHGMTNAIILDLDLGS